ncbi:MAG: carbohydrate ABC transporter permease [Anaerolineae bacterium]|nr:carbohydrate ABC transporter permease [Anaerolineae bacterium]
MFPLYWIAASSIKTRAEVISRVPSYIPFLQFQPTLDNYNDVLIGGSVASATGVRASADLSAFRDRLMNSVLIAGTSTLLAVVLGTLAAYAVSRFRIRAESDLMFFILSTRMLPPIVVLIPIFLLFSNVGLRDNYFGLILLYTTVNLPFVVWMMKGFFDEIPVEYEEAAMIDGYSRLEAIWKVVIPEAIPAMLATAVFSAIVAWNEFVFANLLNRTYGSTVPPWLNSIIGVGAVEWGRLAAASVVFVIPIVIFTFLVRNHLLRGVTFGAVRR